MKDKYMQVHMATVAGGDECDELAVMDKRGKVVDDLT